MEKSKLLKSSWIIYTVLLIVGMGIAVANIISPHDFFVKEQFESYTGQSWSTLIAENPKQAALYKHFIRAGACAWLPGLGSALFITLAAYRKGKKWAWMALIISTILANGTHLIHAGIIHGGVRTPYWIFWLCISLVVLLLPAKEFLGHKAAPAGRGSLPQISHPWLLRGSDRRHPRGGYTRK